jgi:hercynine metabolism protein
MESTNGWWQEIERELERQFDRFLEDHPNQKELLEKEEQGEKLQRLQNKLQILDQQAVQLRQRLCNLSAEINHWRQRVQRAQQAEAYQLADQAEAHLSKLMGQGRDCWQALTELGIQDKQLKEEIQALPTNKNNIKQTSMEDLETAWKNFEANQALENLKKEQQK